jgi:hypothetical protein
MSTISYEDTILDPVNSSELLQALTTAPINREDFSTLCLPREENQIQVQINVQVFKVLSIDTSNETISLDLGLSFMWIDPYLREFYPTQYFSTHPGLSRLKGFHSAQEWPSGLLPGVGAFDPFWKIQNCVKMNVIKSITMVNDPSLGKVHNFTHVVTTVHHPLQMKNFPFDTQSFMIFIRTEHETKVMRFTEFGDREPKIFDCDTTEWRLKDNITLSFALDGIETPAAGGISILPCS